MSKRKMTAAAVTAPETVAEVVTAPEVVPVAEVAAPAPEAPAKTKLGRDELRKMGVSLVFTDEDEARAHPPTYTPAEGSKYDLYVVSNGETYYTWSIDSRRAYEHVCRHLGFEARKLDKPARTSAVTAIKNERDALLAEVAALKAQIAAGNGSAH
jgi:hypothetical protein